MNIFLIKTLTAGVLFATASNSGPVAFFASMVNNVPAAEVVQKTPDELDIWLEKLADKESEGKPHLKVLDDNNYYSYGCLQFQMGTFKSYVKEYGLLPEAEDKELENMIYDCDFQKILARKMIEENPANWRHWYTSVSVKKLGLPPKQEILALAGKN